MDIFIVDDERLIAETLAVILRNHGYVVASCTEPLVAIAQIVEKKPCLLISDHSMPKMTGLELTSRVLEQHPSCRTILFSADLRFGDYMDYRTLGEASPCEFLSKPVHPTVLLEVVRRLIGKPQICHGAIASLTLPEIYSHAAA